MQQLLTSKMVTVLFPVHSYAIEIKRLAEDYVNSDELDIWFRLKLTGLIYDTAGGLNEDDHSELLRRIHFCLDVGYIPPHDLKRWCKDYESGKPQLKRLAERIRTDFSATLKNMIHDLDIRSKHQVELVGPIGFNELMINPCGVMEILYRIYSHPTDELPFKLVRHYE